MAGRRFGLRSDQGQSGVGPIQSFDRTGLPLFLAAEVRDFDPKRLVPNRKQLKVMSRDAQLGVVAAGLACREAGVEIGKVDPERFGVVWGPTGFAAPWPTASRPTAACFVDGRFDFGRWGVEGMAGSFPLNFLKMLPNMIASHVSIVHDARGPNNTIHQAEASSLLAVAEAVGTIQRGAADLMLVGGASSQLNPFDCIRRCVMGGLSRRQDEPTAAMRPFDADRDGQVYGEGAAVFVIESRRHAESRGAAILARILGTAAVCDHRTNGSAAGGEGMRRAMRGALAQAGVKASQLGHVNAHGLSTAEDDPIEAQAIRDVAPTVPVTAPKSYFGNLGAAGGAMEMAVSVLAMHDGAIPPTLNYERPDPACPIDVIHSTALTSAQPAALLLNRSSRGQTATVVLSR